MSRLLPVAALLAFCGCGHKIGDSCGQNVDCSPLGDRFCDIASPGGYCTVEGCDISPDIHGNLIDSCPSEAVCIRFFQPLNTRANGTPASCTPLTAAQDCLPSERCLCDCEDPGHPGNCLTPTTITDGDGGVVTSCAGAGTPTTVVAHCAPESSERRTCQLTCNSDSDCRTPNYVCRQTGTLGAEPVPTSGIFLTPDGGTDGGVFVAIGTPVKYCAPTGP